jgi:hypothetical protein
MATGVTGDRIAERSQGVSRACHLRTPHARTRAPARPRRQRVLYQPMVSAIARAWGVGVLGPNVAWKRVASVTNGSSSWYAIPRSSRTTGTTSAAARIAGVGMRLIFGRRPAAR